MRKLFGKGIFRIVEVAGPVTDSEPYRYYVQELCGIKCLNILWWKSLDWAFSQTRARLIYDFYMKAATKEKRIKQPPKVIMVSHP